MSKNNKTIDEIKDALPDINSDKEEALSEELDRILAIKKIFKSSDGKHLINQLKNNCFVVLNKMVSASKEEPNLNTLLSLIHEYSANINILSTLQDINTEQEIRNQLDEAVQEAMK